MNEPLIDIGVNLTSFNHDKHDDIIERAQQASVEHLILIGSDIGDSQTTVTLAKKYPNCFATAGIHPHQAKTFTNSSLDLIRQLAAQPQVKALGEMGLDFNRNYSPQPQQLSCFEAQLELATELGLPLYLHQRDAHQDFYALIKSYRSRISNAVIHCFTGNEHELADYLELDLHIGITGWICDERRGLHLQNLISKIPANRLMLETDAPYLLPRDLRPKPKKGKNEPCYLPHILTRVSHCLDQDKNAVAALTTANAKRFFNISENNH